MWLILPIFYLEAVSTKNVYKPLNMNDNKSKIGLGKKEMLEVMKCFICKIPSLKEFWITFSSRLKNYAPKICHVFQKVEIAT